MAEKTQNRYVNEFTGRHNQRELHTLNQMAQVVLGLKGGSSGLMVEMP